MLWLCDWIRQALSAEKDEILDISYAISYKKYIPDNFYLP